MSNTLIQIKRSQTTATPPNGSLANGEFAYSYSSDKLFLGNTNGLGIIAVGGKYYTDMATFAAEQANAAYAKANIAGPWSTVNTVYDLANTTFNQANLAYATANGAQTWVAAAFTQANTAYAAENTTRSWTQASFGQANLAYAQANTALTTGQSAFGAANATASIANTAFGQANLAYAKANTANVTADAAFNAANVAFASSNTKFSSSGGTINGDVSVSGNLSVTGNTLFINVSTYRVSDPLMYLAGNNYASDIVDIGFVANYVNATSHNVHTGIFRDAGTKEYYAFYNYQLEPDDNVIDPTDASFKIAVFNADLKSSNVWLAGANLQPWLTSAFLTANVGFNQANLAYALANTANITADRAFGQANLAYASTNGAFLVANVGFNQANLAYNTANTALTAGQAAFGAANVAYASENTTRTWAQASFGQANLAYSKANTANITADAAFGAVNVAYAAANTTRTWTQDAFAQANQAFAKANTADTNAANASYINTGILSVTYGGTGLTTPITQNGILFGNTSGALKVTAAGTEGQVLQASSTGVPQFGMLDGGSF